MPGMPIFSIRCDLASLLAILVYLDLQRLVGPSLPETPLNSPQSPAVAALKP